MPHFRIAEVQPTVINCRRQIYKMDKICSWEQPPDTTLPVLGSRGRNQFSLGYTKDEPHYLHHDSDWRQISILLCVPDFCVVRVNYSHLDTESYLTGIMHPAHWTCAYLETLTPSKKILPLGLCSTTQIVQYCFHTPQIMFLKLFLQCQFCDATSIHSHNWTDYERLEHQQNKITKVLQQLLVRKQLMEPDLTP